MKGVLDLSMEEAAMTAVGVGTAMLSNSMKARPLYAGIQRHIAFGLMGLTAGYFLKNYRQDYSRRKWLVFEDYIARHPDKFEEPPKVYFKDFIQPWTPIR